MSAKAVDFEKQLTRLQQITARLEAGDLPLEKGVALFKEGLTLARECRRRLEEARQEVYLCSQGVLTEFEANDDKEEA